MTIIPRLAVADEDYLFIWRETRPTGKSVVKRIAEILHEYAAGPKPVAHPVPSKPLLSYVEVLP